MPDLSLIIVAHNMERELPRTVYSALPPYQIGEDLPKIEIIVVDNGSDVPVLKAIFEGVVPDGAPITVTNHPPGKPSPVAAINQAVARCQSEWIGIMIDGARMLSPGILKWTWLAARMFDNPFVHTLAAHLGSDIQQVSTRDGYNQQVEDELLSQSEWQRDGYRLFGSSVPAPSSCTGWFGLLAESNGFFMKKTAYEMLGGFDEKFTAAGGGLANLDFFRRAMDAEFLQPVRLLGEATFHQVHGGITTNHVPGIPRDELVSTFFKEYAELRNQTWQKSDKQSIFLGGMPGFCADFNKRFEHID